MYRIFAHDPGDWGSIIGRVKPKTQKMIHDASLLEIHRYKQRIQSKKSNPGRGVTPSSTL